MKIQTCSFAPLPRQAAILLLASAIGLPVWAQQAPPSGVDQNAPTASQQQTTSNDQLQQPPAREGFWGRINPFARKKWVQKRLNPINDRLSELDQVNAKNAQDIKDVDRRAQAGIGKAQSAADQAAQAAQAAGQQAQSANSAAQQAANHVNQINQTVNGLDRYRQVSVVEVKFHPGSMRMLADSRQQLDQLAASLTGKDGYILEMDAQAPGNGNLGIQRSQQLAAAVERYLVTDHQIPIYRMHAVALGNMEVASNREPQSGAAPASAQRAARVRARTVQIRVMENSLAAQDSASPQGAASSTGPVQP